MTYMKFFLTSQGRVESPGSARPSSTNESATGPPPRSSASPKYSSAWSPRPATGPERPQLPGAVRPWLGRSLRREIHLRVRAGNHGPGADRPGPRRTELAGGARCRSRVRTVAGQVTRLRPDAGRAGAGAGGGRRAAGGGVAGSDRSGVLSAASRQRLAASQLNTAGFEWPPETVPGFEPSDDCSATPVHCAML